MTVRLCTRGLLLTCLLALCACRMEIEDKKAFPTVDAGPVLAKNLDMQCAGDYRQDTDYFPEKSEFEHSSQLQVTYGRNWKRVRFVPSLHNGEDMEFLLVQCGTPVPPHDSRAVIVPIPVARIVTANRSMLGAADELGVVDRLVGMDDPRAATVESVRRRVEQGLIIEASGYAHGSIEPIIAMQPDIYLTFYSAYPQYNMHPKLWALGVRALPQADRLEKTPLARAEWIKFLGLLVNREARANEIFSGIEREYARISEIARLARTKPKVMSGFASSRSVFELFGGQNSRARLLADANAKYTLFDNTFSGGWLLEKFENVYLRSHDAPIWIGVQAGIASHDALIDRNALNGWFKASADRNVYALDRGYRGRWAFHFEDQSMTKPHLHLAETVSILHPELAHLVPESSAPFFTRKLP